MADRASFLAQQREFWDVKDATERKFNRIDTLYGEDRSDGRFDALASERVAWLLSDLDLREDCTIVEIGCGIGAVLRRVRELQPRANLIGLDISQRMIEDAQRAVPSARLEVIEGDSLPTVEASSVDLVICTGVFIHIQDVRVIRRYVAEAARVLKRGGHFRFNVRWWSPERAFSDSIGGRLAKLRYRLGISSGLRPVQSPGSDFNGVTFTTVEIERVVATENLELRALLRQSGPGHDGLMRVNCQKPK